MYRVPRCKLSNYKQKRLCDKFLDRVPARRAAKDVGVHRNTASLFYRKIRASIYLLSVLRRFSTGPTSEAGRSPAKMVGPVEVDEMYPGSRHRGIPGKMKKNAKRGRGSPGKICLGTIVDRASGMAYAVPLPNASKRSLMAFICGFVEKGATIFTDSWKGYLGLAKAGYKHETVNHAKGEWARGDVTTNHCENLGRQIRRTLFFYNGQIKKTIRHFIEEALFFYKKEADVARCELRTLLRLAPALQKMRFKDLCDLTGLDGLDAVNVWLECHSQLNRGNVFKDAKD